MMNLRIQDLRKIQEFREKLSSTPCRRCDLGQSFEKQQYPVTSRGSGRIMFIGVAPSPDEHNTGKPFQGSIGENLNRILQRIGLDTEVDCYFTNIIKCHPESVNSFRKKHYQSCLGYLVHEVQTVDPELVVIFGNDIFDRIAYKGDFPGFGKPAFIPLFGQKRWVIVTYNPGVIFRNQTNYKIFLNQVNNIARWLDSHLDFYKKKGIPKPFKESKEDGSENEPEYILLDTEDKVRDALRNELKNDPKFIAIDTETTGLNVQDPSFELLGVSIAFNEHRGYYLPINHAHPPGHLVFESIQQLDLEFVMKVLKWLVQDKQLVSVFHNYSYDYRVLKKYGLPITNRYHDTMILAYLYNENYRLNLKEQTYMWFNIAPDKFQDVTEGQSFKYVDLEKATKYAAADAVNTYRLFKKLLPLLKYKSKKITSDKLYREIYPDELKVARIMADAEDYGLALDEEYLHKLKARLEDEQRELLDKLDSICNVIDHTSVHQLSSFLDSLIVSKEFDEYFKGNYGWGADEAHLKLLREEVEKLSSKGVLESHFNWTPETLNEYIDTLLNYRKVSKYLSTYVIPLLTKSVRDENGNLVIHGRYNTTGTTSGRFSSEDPNLQNLPRDSANIPKKCQECGREGDESKPWYFWKDDTNGIFKCRFCKQKVKTYSADIRRAFIPRPGRVFTAGDWDMMEVVIAAIISGDKNLVEIVKGKMRDPDNPNYDFHRVTASAIFGVPPEKVTKEQRQMAKFVNFGSIYLITETGLKRNLKAQAGIDITEQQAKEWLDLFYKKYPGLKSNWIMPGRMKLMNDNYITHPYGRIRHVPKNPSGSDIRSALNFVDQGFCASIMKRTLIEIDEEIKKLGIDAQVVTVVHDEIVIETPIEDAIKVAQILDKKMNRLVKDKVELMLMATPEIKFSLSKESKAYSIEEFEEYLKTN